MSRTEEKDALAQEIDSLRDELDLTEFSALNTEQKIDQSLDRIADLYLKVKQFQTRYGINRWLDWGPPLWNDIERNEAALRRKLESVQRSQAVAQRRFDRWLTVTSLFFLAVSAIGAAVSAYYSYKTVNVNPPEQVEAPSEKKPAKSKSGPAF